MFGRWKIPTKHVYIHQSLIVAKADVKPDVAQLNKQLKLDDDPEMRRIKEEMEKKMKTLTQIKMLHQILTLQKLPRNQRVLPRKLTA